MGVVRHMVDRCPYFSRGNLLMLRPIPASKDGRPTVKYYACDEQYDKCRGIAIVVRPMQGPQPQSIVAWRDEQGPGETNQQATCNELKSLIETNRSAVICFDRLQMRAGAV
jgi:hypothetical protein